MVFEVPAQFGQGSFSDVSFSKREFSLRCSFEMKAVLPTVLSNSNKQLHFHIIV